MLGHLVDHDEVLLITGMILRLVVHAQKLDYTSVFEQNDILIPVPAVVPAPLGQVPRGELGDVAPDHLRHLGAVRSHDPDASRAAYEAVQQAASMMSNASQLEQDLINALQTRYTWPAPADRSEQEQAYAEAMRQVWKEHPDDGDVAALTAEAVMMLRPWKLWSPEGEPAPETPEIRAVLEAGLEIAPDHPALCHLYIHTMEAAQ